MKKLRIPSDEELEGLYRAIQQDIELGMAKAPTARCQCIPTRLPRWPLRGDERGKFMLCDVGGTNLRLALVAASGRDWQVCKEAKWSVEELGPQSGVDFMEKLATKMTDFYEQGYERVGFTFSFPFAQPESLREGILLAWSKSWSMHDLLGQDIVGLLQAMLPSYLVIEAMVNDVVACLLGASARHLHVKAAVILGTGTNACMQRGGVVYNLEWGALPFWEASYFDLLLDQQSNNPGQQHFEKQVSALYLSQLYQLMHPSETISHDLCELTAEPALIERSVSLVAAGMVAICSFYGEIITIAIDGSLYAKYPGYQEQLDEKAKCLAAHMNVPPPILKLTAGQSLLGAGVACLIQD